MSARSSKRIAKRGRTAKGRAQDVEQAGPDEVPSDFMSEADRNQGVARPDPFDGFDAPDDESFEAPKRRG